MTTIARAAVTLFVLVAASPARAAPIDEAKRAFAEGKAAFERGEYETALASYQRANMILPAPNLYYNIGATYERLGRYQEAALAFDKYFEMAGVATTDDERAFQEKLRARADADRHRANLPPPTVTPTPAPATPLPPPQTTRAQPPYYMQPYYAPTLGPPRALRLKEARARRTRAIVLMGIGVPLSVAGIGVFSWSVAAPNLDLATRWGAGFVGFTFAVVGITLWAPGAASYVRSNREVVQLSKPEPLPPTGRGF